MPESSSELSNEKFIVEKIFLGDYGLPMTYWAFGVLGGLVWGAAIAAMALDPYGDLISSVQILFASYYGMVYVGIWRSATRYGGSKVWAVLAKFVVVLTSVLTAIGLTKWVLVSFSG
jgi:hypothetical protein